MEGAGPLEHLASYSIPPILVSPLLWGLERHRAFFDAQIQVLLAQHIPTLLAKTQP